MKIRQLLLLLMALLLPELASGQVALAPYLLRASAALSADVTLTPSLGSGYPPAGLMRVRVASASALSLALKIQVPEVEPSSGARVLCTLATLTANGDYLFALGGAASSDISGSCLGVPPNWQLFLDHSAGSANIGVEVYPLVQATGESNRQHVFSAGSGIAANNCLTSNPSAQSASSACGTTANLHLVSIPIRATGRVRLTGIVCLTGGGHIGLDASEEVRVRPLWKQPDGAGGVADTAGTTFATFLDADDQPSDTVFSTASEISPYTGSFLLALRVEVVGTITTIGSIVCSVGLATA